MELLLMCNIKAYEVAICLSDTHSLDSFSVAPNDLRKSTAMPLQYGQVGLVF